MLGHDRNSDDIKEGLVWYYDMHTNFWSEILNDGHQTGELGEEGCVIVTGVFKLRYRRCWIGFILLRMGRIGGLL